MYEDYLDEYQCSEQELKEKIYSILKSLNNYDSEEWSDELVESANPDNSSSEVIRELSKLPHFSSIKLLFEEWNREKILNYFFSALNVELETKNLISLLLSHFHKVNQKFFLMLRYSMVTTILSDKLGQQTTADDPATIQQLIMDGLIEKDKILLSYIAEEGATEEIENFYSDENNQHYIQEITNVEASINLYIKEHLYRLCNGMFFQLAAEAILKNSKSFHDHLILEDSINKDEWKEVVKFLEGMTRRSLKTRLQIKDERGGARPRKGFFWDDEKKAAFYKAVESLPKVKPKDRNGEKAEISCWSFALDRLIEDEFDSLTTSQLKKHKGFTDIPESLFNKAVKTWRRYLPDENWKEMKKEDKPRAFEFLHALHRLGYPDEFTYSSLDTYYFRGKKIHKNSDFQK